MNKILPFKWRLKLKYILTKNKKMPIVLQGALNIIVAIAADYGNLGDIAITLAQIKFLADHFPNHEIITIYVNDLYMLKSISKSVNEKDIITIIGGGNMGDVYEGLENQRRYIINLFPNNKIISFPQSIDFKGEKSLDKSIKIYSKHRNLHIFAREPQSYEMMKKSFKNNNVYLVPDIVLFLNKREPQFIRDGITLSLRNDREKKIPINQQEGLVLSIKERYPTVNYYDTTLNNFSVQFAEKEFDNILDAYKKSKVVVTDRLHGMIFCAITKTPCVVFPNSNHKIESTYHKWLSNLNYIVFVENFDNKNILNHIDSLYNININNLDTNLDFQNQYQSLWGALNS